MTIEYTLKDLPDIANKIVSNIKEKIVLFEAEMGVGKTTLIKEICKHLGVESVISSPTYSLVNEYESRDGLIYHFDFYRIEHEYEAIDIGAQEYFDSGAFCFIEWPERIDSLIPPEAVRISLTNEKGTRTIEFKVPS